jgi:predicted dehydrogenase
VILKGAELAVKPEESLLGIRVIEAAFESSEAGIRVKL